MSASLITRRFLQPSTPSILRSFTTSSRLHRTPALADVVPGNASQFDQRQREFRDQQKAAQEAKAKHDSQSSSRPISSSASESISQTEGSALQNTASDVVSKLGLGSLSTHNTEKAREESTVAESSKRKGAFASLIYGTHEGQQMDREIERSFSQTLARGKYVHSIVFHTVKPDKVDEYVDLVGKWYPKMAALEGNHVNLVGSWRTEVGDCDTFGTLYSSLLHTRNVAAGSFLRSSI